MEDNPTSVFALVLFHPALDWRLASAPVVVLLTRLEPLVVAAVLRVLLVLRVEVVDRVRHDVSRVHRLPVDEGSKLSPKDQISELLPEGGGDGLHSNSTRRSSASSRLS